VSTTHLRWTKISGFQLAGLTQIPAYVRKLPMISSAGNGADENLTGSNALEIAQSFSDTCWMRPEQKNLWESVGNRILSILLRLLIPNYSGGYQRSKLLMEHAESICYCRGFVKQLAIFTKRLYRDCVRRLALVSIDEGRMMWKHLWTRSCKSWDHKLQQKIVPIWNKKVSLSYPK